MIKEQFIYFKEILTGVQTDSTAKIIRALCFLVLLGGTAWSVSSYLNASRLSDTSIEMNIPSRAMTSNRQELDKVLSLAQSVNSMRTGGERLASQMTNMNKKLFNTDALVIPGIDTEQALIPGFEPEVSEDLPPEVKVKAVMMVGKNAVAVVSVGDRRKYQGLIVRNGYELPDKAGKIISIKPQGITVKVKDEEIYYEVASKDEGEDSYIDIRTRDGRPII